MRLLYYPETDSLYIELNDRPGTETSEIVGGPLVDFDEAGNVTGIDIDHAPKTPTCTRSRPAGCRLSR